MRSPIAALITCLFTVVLSGCDSMYRNTYTAYWGNPNIMNSQYRAKHPRQQFVRGEQVGPEVPFTSSQHPNNISTATDAANNANTSPTNDIANKTNTTQPNPDSTTNASSSNSTSQPSVN